MPQVAAPELFLLEKTGLRGKLEATEVLPPCTPPPMAGENLASPPRREALPV